MNILPFILSFLLLMSLLVGSMLKEMKGLAIGKKVVETKMHEDQNLQDEIAVQEYNDKSEKVTTPPIKKDLKKPKQERQNNKPISRRSYYCSTQWAKFQLRSLLDKPESAQGLPAYNVAIRLIDNLYGHTKFWKEAGDPKLAHKIIDTLIKESDENLIVRFARDPKLEKIFRLMLAGTNSYDVKNNKGYPPFLDFFSLEKNGKNKAIAFVYASYPVLQAAIGEKLVEKLKTFEPPGAKVLLREDFEALIQADPHDSLVPANSRELITYGKIDSNVVLTKDAITGVTSRLPPALKKKKNAALVVGQ
jgi:hypothetical protein